MHSKYDSMQENGMNYALKCTDNNVVSSINCMLLETSYKEKHLIWKNVVYV